MKNAETYRMKMAVTRTTEEDEIDLAQLARTLWDGRRTIVVTVTAAIFIACAYLNLVDREYTVSMVLKSVQEENQPSSLAGLGGIASFAGIDLPSGSNADFSSFPLLMQSREVAERLLSDDEMMRSLFEDEWDLDAKAWRQPERSGLRSILSYVKSILTGNPSAPYVSPDAARLADLIFETVSASIDSKSELLNVSAETEDPALIRRLIEQVVLSSDTLLRERFIKEGSSALEFYKAQLSRAQSGEHREALAQLIVQEEQKLMLATRSSSYVAEVFRGPDISLEPTSPKSILVLALSLVIGLVIGSGIVLMRNAFLNRRPA